MLTVILLQIPYSNKEVARYRKKVLSQFDFDIYNFCVTRTGVRPEIIAFMIGFLDVREDDKLKKFLHCFTNKNLLASEIGYVNYNNLMTYLNNFDLRHESENMETLDKCVRNRGAGNENIFKTVKCIFDQFREYEVSPMWNEVYRALI